ncbi:MAG TPA: adenosylcobinamide-GDP ribazoletransferase [Thermohalobaculum sp.]|nr:adenosylcobinamide-GDP ribazoletransferase [Thermohalobaculum sp.]
MNGDLKHRALDEVRLILSALGFLTRLPVPAWTGWEEGRLVRASRFFPAVGALIGAGGAAVWWLAGLVLPPMLAAGLALAAILLLTGALHEDGLADCADGLGGGKGGAEALEIMRDSRIGSYGALALALSLGLRWAALAALAPGAGALALILAGGIGRAMMVPATALARYARTEGLGSMVAAGAGPRELGVALATALLLAVLGGGAGLAALAAAAAAAGLFLWFLVRRVGGYTGDGLGAIAQFGEIAVMLVLAGAWR